MTTLLESLDELIDLLPFLALGAISLPVVLYLVAGLLLLLHYARTRELL